MPQPHAANLRASALTCPHKVLTILSVTHTVNTQDVPVKQRRATSASVVQARSPWGDLPADRPPSRQKPPPESLDLFAGGTADPRGLVMELRGGRQRPMTAMAAAGMNGGHGGSRGGMMPGGVAQAGGAPRCLVSLLCWIVFRGVGKHRRHCS